MGRRGADRAAPRAGRRRGPRVPSRARPGRVARCGERRVARAAHGQLRGGVRNRIASPRRGPPAHPRARAERAVGARPRQVGARVAIAAASDDSDRASLLDEAAFAAKDLAALPERAIVYLESIHALRPEDQAADAALERLYEKQGHTSALIELLDERLARSTGFQHRELLRKMASLWLDLGTPEQAIAIVERMLADAAPVADVIDL